MDKTKDFFNLYSSEIKSIIPINWRFLSPECYYNKLNTNRIIKYKKITNQTIICKPFYKPITLF